MALSTPIVLFAAAPPRAQTESYTLYLAAHRFPPRRLEIGHHVSQDFPQRGPSRFQRGRFGMYPARVGAARSPVHPLGRPRAARSHARVALISFCLIAPRSRSAHETDIFALNKPGRLEVPGAQRTANYMRCFSLSIVPRGAEIPSRHYALTSLT